MNDLQLELQTLTPLWTGGVETGQMDRIHETGIIGSLRWWYEAIVRGLGGDVCDPTADAGRCPRHDKTYCDVCRLFGATGCSRRFRLRMEGGNPLPDAPPHAQQIPLPSGRRRWNQRQQQYTASGWYLQTQAWVSNTLQCSITRLCFEDPVELLLVPLTLIHRHASLGAKVSNGYGVLELVKALKRNGTPIIVDNTLLDRLPSGTHASGSLPDLRDFFFAKLSFQEPSDDPEWWQKIRGIMGAWEGQVMDGGMTVNVFRNAYDHENAKTSLQNFVQHRFLPLAPAVRNWLRYLWGSGLTGEQKAYLFGTTATVCPRCCASPGQGFPVDRFNDKHYWCHNCKYSFPKGQQWERIASKINVTHAYRRDDGLWEFRIWGWIPCSPPEKLGLTRDSFLKQLHTALKTASEWTNVFGSSSAIVPSVDWYACNCNGRDDHVGRRYLETLLEVAPGGGQ